MTTDWGAVEEEQAGLYQCSRCRRRYHRTEHLARHVRSVHTKQRPYTCRTCGKAFGRLDVLKRHEANTHSDDGPPVAVGQGDDTLLPGEVEGSERVSQACGSCKTAKVKCSERKPCSRCVGRGLLCVFEVVDCEDVRPESPEVYTQPGLGAEDTCTLDETTPAVVEDFSFGAEWDLAMTDLSYLQTHFDAAETDGLEFVVSGAERQDGNNNGGLSPSPPMTPEGRETVSVTGSWEPQSSENSEMERAHLAADEESLRTGGTPQTPGTPIFGCGGDGSCSGVVLSLSAAARNAIVCMILHNTSRANAGPVLAAFPSAGALDALLGVYARECWGASAAKPEINDMVHLPTLRLERQRPELLGALVAMGAIRAGSAVARKFGFAMQEVVRVSSFRSWEENNADFCDISLSQGFFLQQHTAFFSGVRRKVAFAEACSGCMQILIKNGGHLHGAMEPDHDRYELRNVVGLDDRSLEDVWHRWSIREAQRRLVYAAYIMDSHVGMAHGTRFTSRYEDMRIPFPAPRRLWRAESAVRWREEMIRLLPGSCSPSASSLPPPALSLRELTGDPTLIARPHYRGLVDENFVTLGFYAGLWVLVEECRQLRAISAGGRASGQWSAMILSSRRLELGSMLKLFETSLMAAGWERSPGAEVMSEVLHMYISTSLDGSELRDVSVSSMPPQLQPQPQPQPNHDGDLRNGVEGPEHRSALWRAGRVLRAARHCSPGTLCEVYVVAVRHAAVLLWRHGRLMSLRGTTTATATATATAAVGYLGTGCDVRACVVLDGDDDVQEYQVLSRNVRLALRGIRTGTGTGTEAEPVALEDTAGTMRVVKGVVEGNWRGLRVPPGVEEVCCVLDGLAKVK
ncbi:hypothetical protein CORC01_07498 [Colletotrichum orchidophilum]|uniref:C6 transcription factor n=1 Tax=Colletotrichum orchidophilum TaxID=1209926 RepID=A0A1G4B779_9PEZI|nr:uncharacterized protein CORC01_07498 [Colletotrichum orchidophilum]OHE97244.1 hypothetical protein CORC01_07498 [Colletotrichum orchidophilum]